MGIRLPPSRKGDDVNLARPCLVPGCGRLTTRTRCLEHRRAWERARGTRQERGYGADYQRARRELVACAELCAWCGRPASPADPMTADHLVPLSEGGGIEGNLVPAHRSCNSRRATR
jgi:5-methylcytosine-specific restriction endonuclease McrA